MTAAVSPGPDLRVCRLYRFYVEHPITGEEVLGYVGETIREPVARLLEHLRDQPWFDTVVRWERDPRVFRSKAEVLEAERLAIAVERPLYNVLGNEHNDERITPPDAIRQRRARDARLGEPSWVHPKDRSPDEFGPVRLRARPAPRKAEPWPRWRKHLLGWAITWPILTVSGWVTLVVQHTGGWKQTGMFAAVAATILVGFAARWVWLGCPMSKRAWRRAKRRRR